MDSTFDAVSRLRNQGLSIKEISRRVGASESKIRKILITIGEYSTPTISSVAAMRNDGMSVADIADKLGVTVKCVNSMMPYTKCMYNATYLSINAVRIRQCREKTANKKQPPENAFDCTPEAVLYN